MLTENLVQDVATEEYMTPKAVALVNATKALSPRLLERARPTYEEGIVPTESVKEMAESVCSVLYSLSVGAVMMCCVITASCWRVQQFAAS